ncbi:MAG: DNA polymerase I, partial [Paramuribaculum sp.]|nr:DNA polymerase I [Paramuribaculum sp.]
MEQKKLFLLDAYALIYRAYYALIRSPRITTKGVNTSAIFGFCNTLDEVLRKENPTHIAVCFDPSGKTFRHEAYAEYKAQRDKQPEDITASVPYIKRILAAYNIPSIEVEGYEADDVIGTLSRLAEKEGFITYMMTPDKDYGQLVTDKVFMYRPSLRGEGFEIRGPKEICAKYLIDDPKQVIDMLALEGDASDNIPGCPGVGEKTAAKLISAWGSVENLLSHTQDVKGALRQKIEDNAENIRFSKFLATIKTDVPIGDITPGSLKRKSLNVDALIEIYRELEFRTFLNRLGASQSPALSQTPAEGEMGSLFDVAQEAPKTSLKSGNHDYQLITNPIETAEAVKSLLGEAMIAIAVNATGEFAMTARVNGIALSAAEGKAVYIAMPEEREQRAEISVALQPLFDKIPLVISHNVKREIIALRRENIYISDKYYDTSVAHYLIDPEMKHELSFVASKYLDYALIEPGTATPKSKAAPLSREDTAIRFGEIADITLRLYPILAKVISEQNLEPLLTSIEMPLVRVLADMEWTGVRIDVRELAELERRFREADIPFEKIQTVADVLG